MRAASSRVLKELEQTLAALPAEKAQEAKAMLRQRMAPHFARSDAEAARVALVAARKRLETAEQQETDERERRDQAVARASGIRDQAVARAAEIHAREIERASRAYELSMSTPESRLAEAVKMTTAARDAVREASTKLGAALEAVREAERGAE